MIITNKKVDKTFSGEECLLLRKISEEYNAKGIKTFSIITEKVNYITTQEATNPAPEFKADGTVIQGDPVVQDVTRLVILEGKDSKRFRKLNKTEYNQLYSSVKANVTLEGDDLWQFEEDLKVQALLLLTKQDEPYNTVALDWIILE